MKEQKIKDIVDACLQKWIGLELNSITGDIHPDMAGPDQNNDEEWKTWLPVASTVTDNEIELVEKKLGYTLPDDYKVFLKYKHFYELHISEASFADHAIDTWQTALTDMAFDGYPKEYLIDKGYVPFADWSDWGLLCFDTNGNKPGNNYPVVMWDHERPETAEEKAVDFFDLLIKLEVEEKENSE